MELMKPIGQNVRLISFYTEICLVVPFGETNEAHIKAGQIFKILFMSCIFCLQVREAGAQEAVCGEVNLGTPAAAVRNHLICHSSHFNRQQESDL